MARISKDYDTHTKDDLLHEANLRKLEVNTGTHKADIIAALEMNDEETAETKAKEDAEAKETAAAQAATKLPKPEVDPLSPAAISAPKPPGAVPANIPKVAVPKADEIRYLGQPPKMEAYKGSYIERSTGEPYALAILPEADVENNKTHFLKNNVHFHNLTEEEFRQKFEKA